MLNAAFVERLNGTLQDPRFGSYVNHDKGGCEGDQEEHGEGFACFREYVNWQHKVRLTFTFKTYASQPTVLLDHITTTSNHPDVFVMATGAWDFYYNHPVQKTIDDTKAWLYGMRQRYPSSTLVFFTLVSCYPSKVDVAQAFNKGIQAAMASETWLHFIDRQTNTLGVTDTAVCEGWHALGPLAQQHLASLLDLLKRLHVWHM